MARKVVLSLLLLAYSQLFWTPNSAAQTVVSQGIVGQVVDVTGAAVIGATVSIQNPATGFSATVRTDEAGRFSWPALPIGSYLFKAAASGFREEHRAVLVHPAVSRHTSPSPWLSNLSNRR